MSPFVLPISFPCFSTIKMGKATKQAKASPKVTVTPRQSTTPAATPPQPENEGEEMDTTPVNAPEEEQPNEAPPPQQAANQDPPVPRVSLPKLSEEAIANLSISAKPTTSGASSASGTDTTNSVNAPQASAGVAQPGTHNRGPDTSSALDAKHMRLALMAAKKAAVAPWNYPPIHRQQLVRSLEHYHQPGEWLAELFHNNPLPGDGEEPIKRVLFPPGATHPNIAFPCGHARNGNSLYQRYYLGPKGKWLPLDGTRSEDPHTCPLQPTEGHGQTHMPTTEELNRINPKSKQPAADPWSQDLQQKITAETIRRVFEQMGARAPTIPNASDFRGAISSDYEEGQLPPLPTHPGKVFTELGGPPLVDLLAAGPSRSSNSWGSQASLASVQEAEGEGMTRAQHRQMQQQARAAQAERQGAIPKTSTPQAAPSPRSRGRPKGSKNRPKGKLPATNPLPTSNRYDALNSLSTIDPEASLDQAAKETVSAAGRRAAKRDTRSQARSQRFQSKLGATPSRVRTRYARPEGGVIPKEKPVMTQQLLTNMLAQPEVKTEPSTDEGGQEEAEEGEMEDISPEANSGRHASGGSGAAIDPSARGPDGAPQHFGGVDSLEPGSIPLPAGEPQGDPVPENMEIDLIIRTNPVQTMSRSHALIVADFVGSATMEAGVNIRARGWVKAEKGFVVTCKIADAARVIAAFNSQPGFAQRYSIENLRTKIHKCVLICLVGVPRTASPNQLLHSVIQQNNLPGRAFYPQRYVEEFTDQNGHSIRSNRFSFVPDRIMYAHLRELQDREEGVYLAASYQIPRFEDTEYKDQYPDW